MRDLRAPRASSSSAVRYLDLIDPPRLVGTLSTTKPDADVQLNGDFDAVFYDAFVRVIDRDD